MAAEWQPVPETKTKLSLECRLLSGLSPVFRQRRESSYLFEHGEWSSSGPGPWPRAELLLVWLTRRGYFFNDVREPKAWERARSFFPDDVIVVEGEGDPGYRVRKSESRRFTLAGTVPCVFVRRYLNRGMGAGRYESIGGGGLLGNVRVDGYYCDEPGARIEKADEKQLLDSLGARY